MSQQVSSKSKNLSLGEKISQALTPGSQPSTQDVLNYVFVMRQIFGLILGILAGTYHLQGIFVIIYFAIMNMVVVHYYVFKYLKMDEKQFEENEIYTDSIMISVFVFILSWTLVYTFTL